MDSSAVEKPAYWRMVQGRTAYMVACGPRMKGSKPGKVLVCGRWAVSSAVYSGLTQMPSGVSQFSAFTSPPGADFWAALVQASRVAGANSGCLWLMAGRYL
ncbi:hypothetical protein D9M69_492060 [compost metagenome]